MASSIAALGPLGHMPMRDMSISDSFQLELAQCLTDIRAAANKARGRGAVIHEIAAADRSHLRYLLGRLHGVMFGFSTLLIYKTGTWEALSEIAETAHNEAAFLTDEYLWERA